MEDAKIIKELYQNVEMSHYSTNKLLVNLKDKDNKIKPLLEDIIKDYEAWLDKLTEFLKKRRQKLSKNNMTEKMMVKMGIKKEVKDDNSDSAIADLLIQGIIIGSNKLEKEISNLGEKATKEELEFTNEYQDFLKETIKKLKKYL